MRLIESPTDEFPEMFKTRRTTPETVMGDTYDTMVEVLRAPVEVAQAAARLALGATCNEPGEVLRWFRFACYRPAIVTAQRRALDCVTGRGFYRPSPLLRVPYDYAQGLAWYAAAHAIRARMRHEAWVREDFGELTGRLRGRPGEPEPDKVIGAAVLAVECARGAWRARRLAGPRAAELMNVAACACAAPSDSGAACGERRCLCPCHRRKRDRDE